MTILSTVTSHEQSSSTAHTDAPTAEHIFEHLHVLMHQYRNLQYQTLKESNTALSHQEHKALGFFQRHPGATLSDLVAHSGRDKAQLTRLLKGLRDKALLLGKVSTDDKRSTHLFLTEKGQAVVARVLVHIQAVNMRAINGLSATELAQLANLLASLQRNLAPTNDGN